MIAQLQGRVSAVGANWAVVLVGGLGVHVWCTAQTAMGLRTGGAADLHTSLVVREDALTLYGFAARTDRDTFELLKSATGIGPKIALAALSVLTPDELSNAIGAADLATLTRVPGVGRKGAERIVIELKDKVAPVSSAPSLTGALPAWREQVAEGLQGLGYSTKDADAACDRVAALAEADPDRGVAGLMKAALRSLAKK